MSKNIIISNPGKKKTFFFIFAAFLGVLLIFLGKCSENSSAKNSVAELSSLDPSEYAHRVESRVEELCNKIDGVGSAYAVVTLKGGYRAIYASDIQSGNSSSKNQTVIIGSGNSEKALLLGYENPEIAGIGIVCSGGDDAYLRSQIISVVASAFNVSTNKIFVTGS